MTRNSNGDERAGQVQSVALIAFLDVELAFFESSNQWQFFAIACSVAYTIWVQLVVFEYIPFVLSGVIISGPDKSGVPGAANFRQSI